MALLLTGECPLSEFRLAALVEALRGEGGLPAVASVDARYVFLLDAAAEPTPEVRSKTLALLHATEAARPAGGFFVTPRKGTISPWSSKATDIFHNCGLTTLRRVERGVHYALRDGSGRPLSPEQCRPALHLLHDRMTEGVYADVSDFFAHPAPAPMVTVEVLRGGLEALRAANVRMGLALSDEEMEYLLTAYRAIRRDPTDVELVMFGQVNSEHCRHKIFNADWVIDGKPEERSLFAMIRHTHQCHPGGTLVAYRDNAAVAEGFADAWFEVNRDASRVYGFTPGQTDIVIKVETHNHPTAISPFPGAATGVGGEIRDEGATGTGSKSKAGLSAFMVSNLRIPGLPLPWERTHAGFPSRLASPLQIMLEGPIGGAAFGNEFGRPQLAGLFRTFEDTVAGRYRGYHKPIMAAGGMGNIKRIHSQKRAIPPRAAIIQLGGPAMRIGLGGGAASSMATGSNAADLDFDSVQRGNAEMERRCQEVIDACIALGEHNPILSIHDIGAGGLSNGCPELIAETGGHFRLRAVPNEDRSMSPMEIWCCEAQERYVLAVTAEDVPRFMALCERERCPAAAIGVATDDGHLLLEDSHFGNRPIDIDLRVILGKPPRMLRDVAHVDRTPAALALDGVDLRDAVGRVLRLPAVASKTFLISITDRSVTGLVARDQMVGPHQVPVSDVAVTATTYTSTTGEAMAMGERTPLALISGPASGRMAVGEALTNIAAACIGPIGNVKLSANWMCACGEAGEDADLFDTVRAVGMELCPQLGVSIPVGKDSLSMRTVWADADGTARRMTAPLSLIVSAFAPVADIRLTVTPDLKPGPSELLLIDLGRGRNRLGGSALAQVYNQVGAEGPDVDRPADLAAFFAAVQELVAQGRLLAYHDRADGGLLVALVEMAMAGRRGLAARAPGSDLLGALFAEELGAVLQVADGEVEAVLTALTRHGLGGAVHRIGRPSDDRTVTLSFAGQTVYEERVARLHQAWSEVTFRMQSLRDNPACAREEYDRLADEDDPGIRVHLTYDPDHAPAIPRGRRPRMAILREQGINGQVEMAAAFHLAGFESVDVHMTDLLSGREDLKRFAGLVACGGFSYGDVLGAGSGWAKSVLFNDRLKDMFARFFARPDSFALGVCNGCQMMSQLKDIIPGAGHWPAFVRNTCEQFEARYVTVEILASPSVLFKGMEGSRVPIPVAHGEGRADFSHTGSLDGVHAQSLVAMRYVDGHGRPATTYPINPSGSPGGLTSFTTPDGRATIMMPHPERGFRSAQMSYRPADAFTGEAGPWMRMFRNARAFVG